MTRPNHAVTLALLLALGGCATLRPAPPLERDAQHRLERALSALDAGRHGAAFHDLAWVHTRCPGHTRGAEALAALAALELDPRNAGGRPAVGAELLGRLIQDPATPEWTRPLAESGYLMALGLGATDARPAAVPDRMAAAAPPGTPRGVTPPAAAPRPADAPATDPPADDPPPAPVATGDAERVFGCGPAVAMAEWTPPPLPRLPGPSMAALLARADADRTAQAARADSLALELAAVRQRLAATEAEIERIRRTLRP